MSTHTKEHMHPLLQKTQSELVDKNVAMHATLTAPHMQNNTCTIRYKMMLSVMRTWAREGERISLVSTGQLSVCLTLKKSWKETCLTLGPYTSSLYSLVKKNQLVRATSNSSVLFLWSLTRSSRSLLLSLPLKKARGSLSSHASPRVFWTDSGVRETLERRREIEGGHPYYRIFQSISHTTRV